MSELTGWIEVSDEAATYIEGLLVRLTAAEAERDELKSSVFLQRLVEKCNAAEAERDRLDAEFREFRQGAYDWRVAAETTVSRYQTALREILDDEQHDYPDEGWGPYTGPRNANGCRVGCVVCLALAALEGEE